MASQLLELILSDRNLEEASRKVMINKGSAGIDRMLSFGRLFAGVKSEYFLMEQA